MNPNGVRLQLLLGPTVLTPAPADITIAIESVSIQTHDDGRGGFQLVLHTGRPAGAGLADHPFASHPLLALSGRVGVVVTVGAQPWFLFDGFITRRQLSPARQPGSGTLTVTGDDIGARMDLEERSTRHEGPVDTVVRTVLAPYAAFGIVPDVRNAPTDVSPLASGTSQNMTDRAFLTALADRYGCIFRVGPDGDAPVTKAYWGPRDASIPTGPALSVDLGPATNVEQLDFGLDGLGPTVSRGTVMDPDSGQVVPFDTVPGDPGVSAAPLALALGGSMRQSKLAGTSGLSSGEVVRRAQGRFALAQQAADATGEIDVLRYGQPLRAGSVVAVRGAGATHDGDYHVRKVIHRLQRGRYRQTFDLAREGTGPRTPVVTP